MLTFLHYSKPLRDFCGFTKVPDASKITSFKQDFLADLQTVFDNLVDITEPICRAIDSAKADMTIFDSSGIEAFVTENNPKYANRIIKQLKAYAKAMNYDNNYAPYKAAYGSMPSHASANPEIKQLFINGHFSRAYIPLNQRAHLENTDYTINENGIPCCPHDETLPMKPKGSKSNLRCGPRTFKFVCPKMKWVYDKSTR